MITPKDAVRRGFLQARQITTHHAKTFYFASRFLPKEKRFASYAIYALCRISDDSVDTRGAISAHSQLSLTKEYIERVYRNEQVNNEVLLAFKDTVTRYNIPKQYFDELIDGMHMDLNKNRYETFNELYSYCYKVAGIVGLIMLKIFDDANRVAQTHALDLGIAMQLTNILRDIKEDYLRNRIYLPQDEMNRFGVNESHLTNENLDENLIALLKFQIQRAREYYHNSTPGIAMFREARTRFVVQAMKDIYAEILRMIEHNRYDIFSQRLHTTKRQKIAIALKILGRGGHAH